VLTGWAILGRAASGAEGIPPLSPYDRTRPRQPKDEPSILVLVVWLAAFVIFLHPLLRSQQREASRTPPSPATLEVATPVPAGLRQAVEAARRALRHDPDAALRHIEDALARADHAPAELRAVLWDWAAQVHRGRWHLHQARDALRAALEAGPSAERRAALAALEEMIQRSQPERGRSPTYRAARDAGPAATLTGRVVIAYLFVDPPGLDRWTDPERALVRGTLERVEHWYQREAEARGVPPPEFVERLFMVPLGAGELASHGDIAATRRTARILAANLGHASLGALLGALAAEEGADQAMFMVHAPKPARSFTIYCARRSACVDEVSLIHEPAGRHGWDQLAYAVAHEGLHLFGADDLYDLRGADDFAPTDVMHHPSARLDHSEVGDLTAWAVGWSDDRPGTPFTVEE